MRKQQENCINSPQSEICQSDLFLLIKVENA
jgi:hypothetical protein